MEFMGKEKDKILSKAYPLARRKGLGEVNLSYAYKLDIYKNS